MSELYKKHRPKRLKRMVGNKETVHTLTNMLERNTLPHTILLSGPSGCGKTTIARILRAALECHLMDFRELNCSDFRGIETIREITRTMTLAPTGGLCRIYLLDEVHQLSRDAQHAALKILEDTPSHVYFFLCTTDPQKLLKTILTRCCHLPVRFLLEEEIELLVRRVSKKEEIVLDKSLVEDIAEHAQGSARQALVLLDKIRNLPKKDRAKALQHQGDEEAEAIELCRALIKKASWKTVAKILKQIKSEPETVRWAVLGYARAVLLSTKNHQAYEVICAFENPFYDSKAAGLTRACYEACFGGEE